MKMTKNLFAVSSIGPRKWKRSKTMIPPSRKPLQNTSENSPSAAMSARVVKGCVGGGYNRWQPIPAPCRSGRIEDGADMLFARDTPADRHCLARPVSLVIVLTPNQL